MLLGVSEGDRVFVALPRSAAIMAAFSDEGSGVRDAGSFFGVVAELANNHRRQWLAEDDCRVVGVSVDALASSKLTIDELNLRRAGLVEELDRLVAGVGLPSPGSASLHTETLGSVIDRLAISWVRAQGLNDAAAAPERIRVALRQMIELAAAYDDLLRDVEAGRRRLPAWVPLKSYGDPS